MRTFLAILLVLTILSGVSPAQQRISRVVPSLEIEILDPNVDSRGNPGVIVGQDAWGQTQVDIAPTILVHRYYYTGNRSFRGPDLPGGPSIIVVFHPRTGQKVYLPVQMLPGSPMVTYTAHSIEYDFGDRAVLVSFPYLGDPTVVYRNGKAFTDRVGNIVHWDKIKGTFTAWKDPEQSERLQEVSESTRSLAKPLVLPFQNMARYIPGVTPMKDSKLGGHFKSRQSATNGTYLPEP